jgi:hypothetical protein
VHPGQQLRIIGGVGLALRGLAADLRMDAAHLGHQRLHLAAGRIAGAGDERGGATQATHQVLAEIGVVVDPGQRARMQGLQHQRAQATGQHRGNSACRRQVTLSGPNQPGSPSGWS